MVMINKTIFLLFIVFSLISCKKENLHKVKFEVEFIQDCHECFADYFSITCEPHYSDEQPKIYAESVKEDYIWDYEYWALKDGDEIVFAVNNSSGSATYRYVMRVYVDGEMVSYIDCYGPYGKYIIKKGGLNNSELDMGIIEFTYHE